MSGVSVRALVEIANLNPEAELEVYSPEEGCVDLFSDRELIIPDSISYRCYPCKTRPGWVYFNVWYDNTGD